MAPHSYSESVMARLKEAGLKPAALIFEMPPDDHRFGNALVVVGLGSMLLRIERDRGEEFLEVAASKEPTRYFAFSDVEIAMGWTTIQEVLDRPEHPQLSDVLGRLRKHFDELNEAFSSEQVSLTIRKIERTQHESRQVVVQRFQGGKLN